MSFEYNDETLQVNVVEFELARMFPKVEQKIVDSYLTKMKKRIADRIKRTISYQTRTALNNVSFSTKQHAGIKSVIVKRINV